MKYFTEYPIYLKLSRGRSFTPSERIDMQKWLIGLALAFAFWFVMQANNQADQASFILFALGVLLVSGMIIMRADLRKGDKLSGSGYAFLILILVSFGAMFKIPSVHMGGMKVFSKVDTSEVERTFSNTGSKKKNRWWIPGSLSVETQSEKPITQSDTEIPVFKMQGEEVVPDDLLPSLKQETENR